MVNTRRAARFHEVLSNIWMTLFGLKSNRLIQDRHFNGCNYCRKMVTKKLNLSFINEFSRLYNSCFYFRENIKTITFFNDNIFMHVSLCVCRALFFKEYNILNTLRPRQIGHHFPDDVFKCTFVNRNIRISTTILLKFDPKVQLTLFQHWLR